MNDKKKVRILSIDGGGMRGIAPAVILKYAEEYLQSKSPGTTIADHFDLIAGTSTGGILAALYLTPQNGDKKKAKFSANDALDFYVEQGYSIFDGSRRSSLKRLWGLANAVQFSPDNLESIFEKEFGNLRMSELMKPCLITAYNMNNKSGVFFTSTEDTAKREFYVQDVLRSTSSAPTYFPPAQIKNIASNPEFVDMVNIDGGVFANNPTMCAYAEARQSNFEERNNDLPTASDMYILSLGTGAGGFEIKNEDKSDKWGLLQWAGLLPEIMIDGSVDTVAFQMNEISKTLKEDDMGDYRRIDIPHEFRNYSPDMSNASKENVQKLLEASEKSLAHAKANGLNLFLDGLIDD